MLQRIEGSEKGIVKSQFGDIQVFNYMTRNLGELIHKENYENYKSLVADRFRQRIDFIRKSDVNTKPQLLADLLQSLKVHL